MSYYASNKIIVFPSSSVLNSGKSLGEDNLRKVVTRITDRNYKLTDNSFAITSTATAITISSGIANIQGYEIVTTQSINVDKPANGTYIIGIRLRFDSGTNLILGDVDGSNVGVDFGFFDLSQYENDINILTLATCIVTASAIAITDNEDVMYRIDSAMHSKSADSILRDGESYTIDQDLLQTSDVEFHQVSTDILRYKHNGEYSDLDTVIESIKDILASIKGTEEWDTPQSTSISGLSDNKLDSDDVVDTPAPNKVLRLNNNGDLPCNITGSANSAGSATTASYAGAIGNAEHNYTIDQNLRKQDDVIFNQVFLGNQSSLANLRYASGLLSLYALSGIEGYIGNNRKLLVNDSGITVTGNVSCTKVYNAVFNDYAEWYERDDPDEVILPGDIIELNPDTGKYRLCTAIASNLVIGVCSDSYGHIVGGEKLDNMEDNIKKYIPIGISGRVYVNVEDGVNIFPGQLLVSSYNGKAMTKVKAQEGTVIGKALGKVEEIDGVRKVLMQIMLR